jgi:hypothetical protein
MTFKMVFFKNVLKKSIEVNLGTFFEKGKKFITSEKCQNVKIELVR